MSKRLTISGFKDRAFKVHNNKYDYSLSIYKNYTTPLKIGCPVHGFFTQKPIQHLAGSGCPQCGNAKIGTALRKTHEEFLEQANNTHGDTYDYTESVYTDAFTKIKIRCRIHGVFEQNPAHHVNLGHGCPKCGKIKMAETQRNTKNQFIEMATNTHKNKYDYSEVNYINNWTEVSITCPLHGDFLQRPGNHCSLGHGCPKCVRYGFNPQKPAILYYIKYNDLYKIGITTTSMQKRFGKLYNNIKVIKTWNYNTGKDALEAEQEILKAFNHYQEINEAFELVGGKTEFFSIDVLKLDKDNHD